MIQKKRILIIPARKGSKRIKNKNSKIFFGKPIIKYSIDSAIKSKLFNQIIITTNDEKIINLVKIYKKKIFLVKRDKKFSTSSSTLVQVLKDVISKVKSHKQIKEIYLLMPCVPLLSVKELISGVKILSGSNCFTSVIENRPSSYWSYILKNKKLYPLFKNKISLSSSEIGKTFTDVGLFSGWKFNYFHDVIRKKKLFKFSPLILPSTKGVDIDTLEDWNYAKKLFRLKL